MDQCAGAAARLPGSDRKDLAIQALAGSGTVSDLAARHGVSRKFVYQQTHKARAVLDDAFSPAVPDGEVLFEVAVTKAWLRQVIVALTLICRKREPMPTVDGAGLAVQAALAARASLQFQGRSSLSLVARCPRASWPMAWARYASGSRPFSLAVSIRV